MNYILFLLDMSKMGSDFTFKVVKFSAKQVKVILEYLIDKSFFRSFG